MRIIVSGAVGRATSKLHCRVDEYPVDKRIYLDLEEVRSYLSIFDQYYQEMKMLLSRNCLIISYENDILPDPTIAY